MTDDTNPMRDATTGPGPEQRQGFDLPLVAAESPASSGSRRNRAASLPEPLLVRNVLWFCRLRWGVISIVLAFGVVALFPGLMEPLGLRARLWWPFGVAAVLALANALFLLHARALARPDAAGGARTNLWAQIVLDLLVVTLVVHRVGSLETLAPFAYLFHIVLACIFFSRLRSLAVTALAGVLFVGCVLAETHGLVQPASLYATPALREGMTRMPVTPALNVISSLGIWLGVWHLASHLSDRVRRRDAELIEANQRLVAAQEEKTKHMLRTTHELKAPFAAIQANTQLLLKGYCGPLPDEAIDIVTRISERSNRLAGEIHEMLQLSHLRSENGAATAPVALDLAEVLEECVGQVRTIADERAIEFDVRLASARVRGVEEHLKMLLLNLLSNAVLYSHEGGRVRVECARGPDGEARVEIGDEGIGIPPGKLPHIFEEYYRTDEAARHNKRATGLGLAIVKHVARTHGIRVRVESEVSSGTRFILRFPPEGDAAEREREEKGAKSWPI